MSEYERDDLRKTDEETGVTLKIIADTDVESPVADDESVIFAVYHRHRDNPAQETLPTADDAKAFHEANAAPDSEWAVFELFAYEHGNIMFKAGASNPFSCPFDSGQVGILALKRADFGVDLKEVADGICESYTDYCNGNAWGYVVEGAGEDNDSCWGFIGDPEDDGAYTEGLDAFASAVEAVKKRLAAEAEEAAKVEAAALAVETSRKVRLSEVLDAAHALALPNYTPAEKRLLQALEAYEAGA